MILGRELFKIRNFALSLNHFAPVFLEAHLIHFKPKVFVFFSGYKMRIFGRNVLIPLASPSPSPKSKNQRFSCVFGCIERDQWYEMC